MCDLPLFITSPIQKVWNSFIVKKTIIIQQLLDCSLQSLLWSALYINIKDDKIR